jgi:methylglutaconyl-CoA hydratase
VARTKQLIGDLQTIDRAEQSELTTKVIAQRRVSKEGQEGLKAFFAKRRPNW